MKPLPEQPADATVDFALPEHLARIREQFRRAWDDALQTGAVPELDAFLYQAAEADRALLRSSLRIIDEDHRARFQKVRGSPVDTAPAPGSDTVNVPASATPASDGTLDLSGAGPDTKKGGEPGTEELLPHAKEASGLTGAPPEFIPGSPRPDATIDFEAKPDTNFELNLGDAAGEKQSADYPEVVGYHIFGILGRGAMGVVYKARQRGLKRIVALKMILAGGHASAHDLSRFRSEAEAVGQLQHPNIVQVHEVGEQNGCPFFSLEYVDGASLNKKIAGNPQPVMAAAEMVETLAHAMDFAHRKAIIHRDLKPANVMLTKPRAAGSSDSDPRSPTVSEQLYGIPKIADFGLAKRLEEDSGTTKSGTILGTPSYMSPEQAAGKTREVGPLSDVYALGAILYEMLTGRPPFRGETLLDTLEQVRTEEPVPPSRLQPKVPRDLETVCLKCLQKEPHKRYATAGELADDLHRFVLGEPIKARAVSARERFWRWCRRNPKIAALSGAVALLLVMVAATSTWFAFQIAAEKEQVEIQRKDAVAARIDADNKKVEAELNAARARAAEKVAGEQRKLALDALGVLVTRVQEQLSASPEMFELRQEIIDTAMKELGKVSKSTETSGGLKDRTMAQGHHQMAAIYRKVGQPKKALEHYIEAHEILDDLAAENPNSDKDRGNLSLSYSMQGEMCLELESGARKAKEYYDKALALQLELMNRPRDGYYQDRLKEVKRLLAGSYTKLGFAVVRLGDPEAAIDYQHKALALREEILKENPNDRVVALALPDSFRSLGDLYWRLGDAKKTKEHHERCIQMREAFLKAAPKLLVFSRKRDLALAYGGYGHAAMRLEDYAGAQEYSQKSLDLLKELAAQDKKNVELRSLLAQGHYRLGVLALYAKNLGESAKHFQAALKLQEDMLQVDPEGRSRAAYMLTLARCGEHDKAVLQAERRLKTLEPDHHEGRFPIACCYALCAAAVKDAKLKERYITRAIELLHEGITPTFKDATGIETDPDLQPIKSDPRFQQLVASVRNHK